MILCFRHFLRIIFCHISSSNIISISYHFDINNSNKHSSHIQRFFIPVCANFCDRLLANSKNYSYFATKSHDCILLCFVLSKWVHTDIKTFFDKICVCSFLIVLIFPHLMHSQNITVAGGRPRIIWLLYNNLFHMYFIRVINIAEDRFAHFGTRRLVPH